MVPRPMGVVALVVLSGAVLLLAVAGGAVGGECSR